MHRGTTGRYEIVTTPGERPIITVNEASRRAGVTFPTATKGINTLLELGIVSELTGQRRNRVFTYEHYLAILNEGTDPL